jgi:hypothetical protein
MIRPIHSRVGWFWQLGVFLILSGILLPPNPSPEHQQYFELVILICLLLLFFSMFGIGLSLEHSMLFTGCIIFARGVQYALYDERIDISVIYLGIAIMISATSQLIEKENGKR